MTRRSSQGSRKKTKSEAGAPAGNLVLVDPCRIRFQHSRIRPVFSGCGRSVRATLESIRAGEMSPSELPPIQVLVGPESDDQGPWYFTLNNRRLWVLKRCREEGLLVNNEIGVRTRKPKSAAEAARYTVEKCALDATIMREPSFAASRPPSVSQLQMVDRSSELEASSEAGEKPPSLDESESDVYMAVASPSSSDGSNVEEVVESNRFSPLFT